MNRRRLYRCTHDRMIAGVAAGVAEYFDVDPTLVRVIWAVGAFFTAGFLFLLYIVMAVVVPLEPDIMPGPGPWQPGSERWATPGGMPGTSMGPMPGAAQPDPSGTGEAPTEGEAADPTAAAAGPDPVPGSAAPGPAWQTTSSWQAAYARPRRQRGSLAPFFGVLLILFGGIALAQEFLPSWASRVNLWPLFIVGIGVLIVVGGIRRRSDDL